MTVGFTACIVLLAARLETALIAALIRFLIPFLAKKNPARLTSIMQFIKLPPPPNIISPFYTKWGKNASAAKNPSIDARVRADEIKEGIMRDGFSDFHLQSPFEPDTN